MMKKVALARRLHDQADFPNLLVKIPDTPQGPTAISKALVSENRYPPCG